ncbi:MAG: c-type cytochrome domain-containing protein, partial [bacterium]
IWTRFEVMGVLAVPLGLMLARTDLPLTLVAHGEAQSSHTKADVSFSEDVTPILEGKCVICHGGPDENGAITKEMELDLTSYDALMVGSEFGPIVEPGNAEDSVLWMMIEVGDMPQEGEPLTTEELGVIKTWIAEGAQNN